MNAHTVEYPRLYEAVREMCWMQICYAFKGLLFQIHADVVYLNEAGLIEKYCPNWLDVYHEYFQEFHRLGIDPNDSQIRIVHLLEKGTERHLGLDVILPENES